MPKDDPDGLTLLPDSITDDQGRTVSYTLNYMGQPLVIDSDQVYNNQGMRVSYLETTDLYDALAGQPGSPYTHGWLAETQTTWYNVSANTSHVLSSNAYTYDTAGLRLTNAVTNAAGSTRTETYTYDDLTRLSSVNYGDGGTQSYTFDAMGNRLSRQDSTNGTTNYAYNAANMLTSSMGTGASAYTDDADGDTLSGGGRGETWDSQNRLVGCSFGSSTDSFKYGADGLRRQSTVNGTVDNYAYDGQSMIREMNASLVSQATYLTGMRGPEYRRNDTQTESDGQGHTFGLTRWYVYDGLGSVVGEVDPLGNLTCADEYDVYGAVRGRTGTASTAHGFVGSLGHLSDASTGLVYMRARYYDPATGRFASEDAGRSGGNWFAYCGNNPINMVDQDGKFPYLIMEVLGALLEYATRTAYDKGAISTGMAIALAVTGAVIIVAGCINDYMEATGNLQLIHDGGPDMLIEAAMDILVPALKSQGTSGAIAGHMLEIQLAVMDIDDC
jgi:RHS repeat-associated protein